MGYLNTTVLRRRGFLLQEVMVGVVIFGIAMYPILRALALLPRVAAYSGEQARAESWRSASDDLVALGIDARQRLILHYVAPNLDVKELGLNTTHETLSAQQGAPQITLISEETSNGSEARARSMGLEIGAASVADAPRNDPLAPLPEIKLATPSLSPSNGSFLSAVDLLPIPAGYGALLQSTAANPTDRVLLQENAPETQRNSATGSTSVLMSAQALARAYSGLTWSEFAGNPETDTQVLLEDGRAEWLVRVGQQVQVYRPSDIVPFIYGVDLGRPVYDFAGAEYLSGTQVAVDFIDAQSISSGVSLAVIGYPAEVKQRFGAGWSQIEPRFQWTFGTSAGDSSSGNTASIFTDSGRSLWRNSQILSATPSSTLLGVRAWTGTWTLARSAITLGPPERVSTYYDSQTDVAGEVDFSAPILSQTRMRVGRPELDGVESVGTTLSSVFVP